MTQANRNAPKTRRVLTQMCSQKPTPVKPSFITSKRASTTPRGEGRNNGLM